MTYLTRSRLNAVHGRLTGGLLLTAAIAFSAHAAADERVQLTGQELGYEPTQPISDDGSLVSAFPFGVQSADGRNIFRIRGRLQMDAAIQDFDDEMSDVARQGHEFPRYGVMFRRLRLGALGIIDETWEWQLEVDFAENEVDLANAYLAYLFPEGRLAAGHFKEPFSMEYATSSRYISFIERSSAADAYKVSREPGVMYETIKPNWYGAFGVFGGGIDYDREIEEGWSIAGRLSFAPYLQDDGFVHIGGGFNHRENGTDKDSGLYEEVRLRTREGSRAIDARLVGRDDLVGVTDYTRSNLELAAGSGPWWMQAEYINVDIDLDQAEVLAELGGNATSRGSLTQDGYYVQAGFFLTGESKPYRAFSGDFGRLRPNQNFSLGESPGAVELAVRYSVADSLEHTRIGRGQKLENWTAGVNWYLTPEIMIKGNVIYHKGERDIYSANGTVYAVRLQYLY